MNAPISFFVAGKPQPAGSKRAFVIKKAGAYTGRAVVTDANPKSRDWKTDVQYEAKLHFTDAPWTGPIRLILRFLVLRPKSHYRTGKNSALLRDEAPTLPTSKPDSTKLCRGVEDALTGFLWADDAQIVTQFISKRYGERQGVWIEMSEEDA